MTNSIRVLRVSALATLHLGMAFEGSRAAAADRAASIPRYRLIAAGGSSGDVAEKLRPMKSVIDWDRGDEGNWYRRSSV
jgi:hypothetical protein